MVILYDMDINTGQQIYYYAVDNFLKQLNLTDDYYNRQEKKLIIIFLFSLSKMSDY